MRRAITVLLLTDALFAACLSLTQGGYGANAVGTMFAVLGIVAWCVAFLLDFSWDA